MPSIYVSEIIIILTDIDRLFLIHLGDKLAPFSQRDPFVAAVCFHQSLRWRWGYFGTSDAREFALDNTYSLHNIPATFGRETFVCVRDCTIP